MSKREGRGWRQLSFADRRRKDGRPRRKPGPKPLGGAGRKVPHRFRPLHKRSIPLHVTLRAVRGLPSFRAQVLYAAFEEAFRTTRREDFRIVEYSVQHNHVHLLVEAVDKDALARGMKSFSVRANRLFNAALGRGRGRVWGDRYHREDLTTPKQVRNALVYVLGNFRKHDPVAKPPRVIDGCSSARWFSGWYVVRDKDEGPRPTPVAETKLLAELWKRHGLLHPGEGPAVDRRHRRRTGEHRRPVAAC